MAHFSMTTLSILISSTPDRSIMLENLLSELNRQIDNLHGIHPTLGRVEIVCDDSKRFLDGGLSIGKKREKLYKMCTGKYACCVDSDDWVAPNYIEVLVRLCQKHFDIITFRSFLKTDYYWSVVDMRLGNPNEEATPDKIIKRNGWHICPVLSKYAKMYDFEDINYGEDWKWFEKVLRHCQSEAHTDQILHSYQHSSKTSEADRITKQQTDAI